ncbi:ATP-binding cassette domain-containing protein [Gordonia amarae]|uniref:ATP-binding cassette domain-containing protein n=1 Tax=Gordonia amarae TaxID=36821 RepID=A0A857MLU2_9ACTN|nr:ATP-binding cassette domain-containing protein [Gordonia amarae]QHN20134.1 ATP-binding cassette domain-containing protein [Gordonia amarae]QHN33522.1 ATP-binding cassette domain-containing protein [Gordonia amarae]QHN42239.1 ATP-binding cassette domain-containing protein [Gordonia amarae]
MELASVAIFGGVTVAAVVIAAVIPMATAAGLLAPVPLAVVAARTRPRALIAAAVATTGVTFAMAGTGAASGVFISAIIGGIVGDTKRRGRGLPTIALLTLIAAPVIAGLTVVLLWILKPLRELMLTAMKNSLNGLGNWIGRIPGLDGTEDFVNGLTRNAVDWWWAWIWVSGTIGTAISIVVAWWILGAVIDRLADVPAEDTLDQGAALGAATDIAPLPLVASGVDFAYRDGGPLVLSGIDLRIDPGEFVAIVGANGSGKSTLVKIIAGRPPTRGTVERPGLPGLGRHGGTAMVLQRPESQMLGSRVADDLVWGLPDDADVDVEALLAEVGLAGFGQRETSDLSGGQQQRLAVAAALARSPQLLIADEVTSMVDPDGRDDILELLAGLPARHGMTVVLITHRGVEAAAADRVIHLDQGRLVAHPPEWIPRDAAAPGHRLEEYRPAPGPYDGWTRPILALDRVGYTYLPGSPWQVHALHDISLQVNAGDGLLIVGGNGSGKTTLAWVMAGLLEPGSGTCALDGEPIGKHVGDVGLGFQHARLQLQRANVGDEIMAAGGLDVGTTEVGRVLDLVGLPRSIAARHTDSLSGGQMRRVVLAGLIARKPKVLILDEPLAGLDPYAREEIVSLLARLRRGGQTIVIISHDYDGLARVCNRRVVLAGGSLQPEHIGPDTGGRRS